MLSRLFPVSRHGQLPLVAIILIATSVIMGGASRLDIVAPIFPRLAAIGALGWIAWMAIAPAGPVARQVWWFWIALLALPLVQMVPLPWTFWTSLPGRELARDIYISVGEQPWAPISLTPSRTLNGLLALLPALASFHIAVRLNISGRDMVIKTIAVLAVASAFLGLLQVASGPSGGLYFYAVTNSDSGVGWFSNANHNSLMLCSGIVCVFYWIAGELREAKRLPLGKIATAGAAIVVLFACLPLTASRAGVLLSLVAAAGGLTMIPIARIGISRTKLAAGIVGGTVVLVGATVAIGYERVFGTGGAAGLLTDGRARNVGDFAAIAWQHFPLGSGLGSFDPVYRVSETVVSIQLNYLNNAHNEPAQILIEAGIGGAVLMLLFVIWLAQSGWAAIRKPDLDARNVRQVRTALLIVAMLTLHSLVDYPLRTMALSAIFALCAGFIAARPTVVTGRARGLALNAWIDTHTHPDFIFPSEARGHMTFA